MSYLNKYKHDTPKFASGGAAPGAGAPAGPGAAPGGMPAEMPQGGAPGTDGAMPMDQGAAGAPMGAGADPALNGGEQGGQDLVAQIEQLVQQYQQAPSQAIEHEGWMMVMQAFGSGAPAGAEGGDPAAMGQSGAPGGAMPQGAAPGPATPPPAPAGAGGGAPGFRRGGTLPKQKGVDMPSLEQPKAIRRAKLT